MFRYVLAFVFVLAVFLIDFALLLGLFWIFFLLVLDKALDFFVSQEYRELVRQMAMVFFFIRAVEVAINEAYRLVKREFFGGE